MTLRTDLVGGTGELGVHADQHNQVNQLVIGLSNESTALGRAKARVLRNGAWTTSTGPILFTWDATLYDLSTSFVGATYTCPYAGDYDVRAMIAAAATAAGQTLQAIIYHNGGAVAYGRVDVAYAFGGAITGPELYGFVSDIVVGCAPGDTIQIYQAGTSGLTGFAGDVTKVYCGIKLLP